MSRSRFGLVAGALLAALCACSSGSGTGTSSVVPRGGVGPPAQPTGTGAVLSQPYTARCRTSVTGVTPPRATGVGSLTHLRLRSPDSSKTLRDVYVYRPGGLADIARMPIVYMLHGLPGDPAALWTQHNEAAYLNTQFARGAFPYVAVTVDGRGAKHDDTEWGDSIDGTDRVESFILDVAIPAVEGTHRRDACHRAIVGFSMGGFGAMNLAQRHPDVFGQVASVAGYFHIDDPDGMWRDNATVEKANTPDQQVSRMKGLRVFLLDAGQENLKLVAGETKRFADLLINAKIPVLLYYAPGSHNTDYAVGQLPALADFLEIGWRP